jgi:hypothetical protein
LVLAGDTGTGYVAGIYRIEGAPANIPPTAPGNLSSGAAGDTVVLAWSAASDDKTPTAGLSYNLRIGTTPGGNQITSAMADCASGCRRVVALGNAQQKLRWWGRLPAGHSYYWSVQAVDGLFAGSAFAAEQMLNVPTAVEEDTPRELTFALASANPVVGTASFRFGLPTRTQVDLSIFDVTGRRVARLAAGEMAAGFLTMSWSSGSGRGSGSAGVYFARLAAGGRTFMRRFIVLR